MINRHLRNAGLCVSICITTSFPLHAASLSIKEFSRDKVVFDVGAAFGRNTAIVPVAGTADPGAAIEVRVVNDTTGQGSGWVSVGPANQTGAWAGEVSIGADEHWYRVEARAVQAPQVTAQSANRFGGGDVIAFLGQSELERLNGAFNDLAPRPSVSSPDQVQFTYQVEPRGGIQHTFINDSASTATPMSALAQFWIDNTPTGRKVHFVDLAHSGTAHLDLADDNRAGRSFDALEAIVDTVRADGSDIGLVMESWFAGDRGSGKQWADHFTGFYTGLATDGSAYATGTTTFRGASVDNFLWDLSGADRGVFDENATKLGIFGPHRFDAPAQEPRINSIDETDGGIAFDLRAIEWSRIGVQDFLANPAVSAISVNKALPVPLDYANGYLNSGGHWLDITHPSGVTPDGAQRLAKHMGNAALLALGHVSYETPVFDLVRWTADYVEVGSTGGKITTARIARGMAPLDDTHAHWTDVLGFEIDGLAAHRAEITSDGFVRIYPLNGQKFDINTVITYGKGGANGFLAPYADFVAQAYLNLPLVDMGLIGLEGVGVLPTPGTYAIPNTFGQAAPPPAAIPLPVPGVLLAGGLMLLGLRGRRRASNSV